MFSSIRGARRWRRFTRPTTRYLERFDTAGEIHLSMMPPPFTSKKDPASVAGLLASGRDSVEFHTLGILVPTEPARLRRHRYTAEYTLTGTVETPSGVTLRTGRVEEVFVNMSAVLQVSPKFTGTIFVDPEEGVLVFGSRELNRSEEEILIFLDNLEGLESPRSGDVVDVLQPGDAHFMEDTPLYGCG